MKKNLLIIFLGLSFYSCHYQKELEIYNQDLKTGTPALKTLNCTKQDTFSNFQDNLADFYSKFVIKTHNINYDTSIDYQKMLDLKKVFDKDFKTLRCSILNHIKNEKLENKTDQYKIAFYINAYNFLIIDAVILTSKNDLIKSVADIGGKDSFRVFGPQSGEKAIYPVLVAGKTLTLNDIEHEIVRPLTNNCDGRLHFAFICASKGCPILSMTPYNEMELQDQLNLITSLGLKLPRIFYNKNQKSYLSEIFNWYGQDMICEGRNGQSSIPEGQAIKNFIRKYTNPNQEFYTLDYKNWIPYDWTLNIIEN